MLKHQLLKLGAKKACPERFRRGLTLVEILVAISISTLLIGALYGIYLVSFKSYKHSVNQAELNQNARIAMERISRDLRQTNRLTTIIPPNDTDLLNPPPSDIMFQDGHTTNQIQYIRYFLDGTNLKRQVIHYWFSSDTSIWVEYNAIPPPGITLLNNIDEDRIKADKITSLKFYGENNLINIGITASDGTSTYTYKTIVLARNL